MTINLVITLVWLTIVFFDTVYRIRQERFYNKLHKMYLETHEGYKEQYEFFKNADTKTRELHSICVGIIKVNETVNQRNRDLVDLAQELGKRQNEKTSHQRF